MKLKIFLFTAFCIFSSLFAQDAESLLSQPSKKKLYTRAREYLKASLENKDFENVRGALGYLQDRVSRGAPLRKFEEYVIYFELGDYEKGITLYEEDVRPSLDSTYHSEPRTFSFDDLNNYLHERDFSQTSNKNRLDSLVNAVNQSDIEQQYKDLFSVLIHRAILKDIENIYLVDQRQPGDSVAFTQFYEEAKNYCANYPNTDAARYLKEQVIPTVQRNQKKVDEYIHDPLTKQYYNGGLSIYVGKWLIGFLSGDATKYLNDKRGTSLMLEAELQVSRFALSGFWSYGLITKLKHSQEFNGDEKIEERSETEDETTGFTFGFVTYDSRFLKITPFIGGGLASLRTIDINIKSQLLLGVNVDSHLWVPRSFFLGIKARFKYMMQYGKFLTSDYTANAFHHIFALELGIFLK